MEVIYFGKKLLFFKLIQGEDPLGWDVVRWWFEVKDEMCLFGLVHFSDPDHLSDLLRFFFLHCSAFQEYGYRMKIACDQFQNACLRCLAVLMPCLSLPRTPCSTPPAISRGPMFGFLLKPYENIVPSQSIGIFCFILK
jgi:hypothetical protein